MSRKPASSPNRARGLMAYPSKAPDDHLYIAFLDELRSALREQMRLHVPNSGLVCEISPVMPSELV